MRPLLFVAAILIAVLAMAPSASAAVTFTVDEESMTVASSDGQRP